MCLPQYCFLLSRAVATLAGHEGASDLTSAALTDSPTGKGIRLCSKESMYVGAMLEQLKEHVWPLTLKVHEYLLSVADAL